MELGADKRSVAKLGAALAVLAAVVYFQFLREAPAARPAEPAAGRTGSGPAEVAAAAIPASAPSARQRGGQFRPRVGGRGSDDPPDPLTADTTLRTAVLDKIRSIEVPSVDRDIFNFGRPKPSAGPPQPEARQAQAVLNRAMEKRVVPAPKPPPKQPPPVVTVRPPDWKYFGLASQGDEVPKRAFLLDGEEILVGALGSVLNGRYRIESIGVEAVVIVDLEANQEFSIDLEVPR